MNILIAGLSDIGRNLAELLVKEGNQVVVIERDSAKCIELAEGSECMVITGDASQKSTLEIRKPSNRLGLIYRLTQT